MIDIPTWKDMVGAKQGRDAEDIALGRLVDAAWFARLGEPTSRDNDVDRVRSWTDALGMFTTAGNAGPTGTLKAPKRLLIERLDADAALNRRTVDAANRALDEIDVNPYLPSSLTREQSIAVGDYVSEYIRLLFIEVHAGDVAPGPRCTYFRDQLPWFASGFLPCGWNGAWPEGQLRVY